jgi:DNA-binding CsgD family transcriptional regulator
VEAGLDAAGVYAFAEAWVHFERALELWDPAVPLPVDRVELLAQAAQAARFAGDPDRAVALCREALDALDHGAEPERAARLYERLGEFQFWDDEAALESYAAALRLTPGEPRLLAAEGHALMGLRRWREARERCEAALAAGAGPRITLGLVLAFLGEPERGEAYLQEALEMCETPEETARAYVFLGEVRRVRGDHAGALVAWMAGEEVAERFGLGSHVGFLHVAAADDLVALGRWEEAARRLAEAERMELGRTAAPMRRAVAGLLHALRGELDAARRELDAATGDGLPSEIVVPLAAARAALALAAGDPATAQVHLDGALAAVQDPFYTPPVYSLALRAEAELAERARAHRRPVDARRATALLADLDALLAAATTPDARAHRALAFAELARVTEEPAAERWQAAAAAWDELAEPYPAAYARLQAAEAILREDGGRRAAAAALLAEAHAAAAALGARPLRDAIESLARRARLDLARAVAPAREEGPAGLTTREAEVLRLLAEGLTNREIAERLFISQKTVSAHLAHIFGKLDVHTRTEAAGRARVLGVV